MSIINKISPSLVLVASVISLGAGLGAWKYGAIKEADAAAASQPEPVETVAVALAEAREQQPSTTAVGTVLALRSITLRNEVPGTVSRVNLQPGQIIEAGTVLVALDVSVETAELEALKAQAALAATLYQRLAQLRESNAVSQEELDQAQAERDVALAGVARTRAIIERKTIRAPFRARVGIADVHPGQYLSQGTELTTLQGVEDGVHVDFTVAQHVAEVLHEGDTVVVLSAGRPIEARLVAIDARVDPETRNAVARAKLDSTQDLPSPGASVQVRVPTGPTRLAVTVPVGALRRGPEGDRVFVIERDAEGNPRARARTVISGPVLNDAVVIESGLSAGEQVATSGSFKLQDSVLVAVAGERIAHAAVHAGNGG